jgi:hypothetical protein
VCVCALVVCDTCVDADLYDIMRQRASQAKRSSAQAEQDSVRQLVCLRVEYNDTRVVAQAINDVSDDDDDSCECSITGAWSRIDSFVDRSGHFAHISFIEVVVVCVSCVYHSFFECSFFQPGGPLASPLSNVLEAYVCYRPDIGYVQGRADLSRRVRLRT